MPNSMWGHCQHCKYFASPARAPLGTEQAACTEPHLQPYRLLVFGASGCTQFELREGLSRAVEEPAQAMT